MIQYKVYDIKHETHTFTQQILFLSLNVCQYLNTNMTHVSKGNETLILKLKIKSQKHFVIEIHINNSCITFFSTLIIFSLYKIKYIGE